MRPTALSTNVYVRDDQGLARMDLALAPRARDPNMLRRVLGATELTLLGVGGTIGAGIFVVTGVVAHDKTGPGLMWAYIIAAICCLFAGLCYAEFAAMVPKAGSAYAYAYETMGELMGWVIGWDLALEYAVSGSSVARGWSQYFVSLFKLMGAPMGKTFTNPPFATDPKTGAASSTGCAFDLPAMCITAALTALLVRGIHESSKFNAVMVALKIAVVLFVILVGSAYIDNDNYHPYLPYGFGGISFFGFDPDTGGDTPTGVFAGAAVLFFAFVGFDAVSCNSEETINPQRNIPIGIVASLGITTLFYVGVSVVLTGMQPTPLINTAAPLSEAFSYVGLPWAEGIISFGALIGLTSVLMVSLIAQPRILMSMARDGLLPEQFFSAIHPEYGTPYKSTIVTGIFIGLVAAFIPLDILVELVSIGTLFAFFLVCVFILILRRTQPNRPRPFKVPYGLWLPGIGAVACFLLMLSLSWGNWIRLIIWLSLGMLIYVFYARKRARVRRASVFGETSIADLEPPRSHAYSNAVGSYTPSAHATSPSSSSSSSNNNNKKPAAHHSDLSFDLSPAAAVFQNSLPATPPSIGNEDTLITSSASVSFGTSDAPAAASSSSEQRTSEMNISISNTTNGISTENGSGVTSSEQSLLTPQTSLGTLPVRSDDASTASVDSVVSATNATDTSSSSSASISQKSDTLNDAI